MTNDKLGIKMGIEDSLKIGKYFSLREVFFPYPDLYCDISSKLPQNGIF